MRFRSLALLLGAVIAFIFSSFALAGDDDCRTPYYQYLIIETTEAESRPITVVLSWLNNTTFAPPHVRVHNFNCDNPFKVRLVVGQNYHLTVTDLAKVVVNRPFFMRAWRPTQIVLAPLAHPTAQETIVALKAAYADLKDEKISLEKSYDDFKAEILRLNQQVAVLFNENAALKAENASLKQPTIPAPPQPISVSPQPAPPSEVAPPQVPVPAPTPLPQGPAATVSTDISSPPEQFGVMGSIDLPLHTVHLTAGDVEDLRTTVLRWTDTIAVNALGLSSFDSFSVYDGATKVAGPVGAQMFDVSTASINIVLDGTGVVAPAGSVKNFTLKGTIATYGSARAVSGSVHRFSLDTAGTVIRGANSGAAAAINGSAMSNPTTVARTKLLLSAAPLGVTSGRERAYPDYFGQITVAADPAGEGFLETLQVMFTGGAATYYGGAPALGLVGDANRHLDQVNAQ